MITGKQQNGKCKEVKQYKVTELPSKPIPDAVLYVKKEGEDYVRTYITDIYGEPYQLYSEGGQIGVRTVTNIDGSISVIGSEDVVIKLSDSLLLKINTALKSGDNISTLINDAGYIVQANIDNKVDKNTSINGSTKTKITYDSKGLVIAGADLTEADIPTLPQSKVTNLTVDLNNKEDKFSKNTAFNKNFGSSTGTVVEGNDSRLVAAFAKKVNAISVTGDTNKTLTLTREDGTVLTATFIDNNTEFPDDVINTLSFNDNNDGSLIAITSEGEVLTVSLDGRYSLLGHVHSIAEITGLQSIIDNKVDKITGKGLSTNDFTTVEKSKLATVSGINTGDETIESLKLKINEELAYACSDETSDLTVGNLISFRVPFAISINEVRISLNSAPTISKVIVDVKKAGVSIFSTLLSIDTSELTSTTASVNYVLSTSTLEDDSLITVSTTQIGSGDKGKGLKILFKGKRI